MVCGVTTHLEDGVTSYTVRPLLHDFLAFVSRCDDKLAATFAGSIDGGIDGLHLLPPCFHEIHGHDPEDQFARGEHVQKADARTLRFLSDRGNKDEKQSLDDGLTKPTGPSPITAIVNVVSSSPNRLPTPASVWNELEGYGNPVTIGSTFGWFSAWNAANTPVGRMSHMSSSELSASVGRSPSTFSVDQKSEVELDRLYRVPPALGTRTYCACPPGVVGVPKSRPEGHRQVKPTRQ